MKGTSLICSLLACLAANARAVTVYDFVPLYYTNADGVLPYRLFIPTNYTPTNTYPIVLFLHGGGNGGTENTNQLTIQKGPLVFASETNQLRHPSFMVAPECPDNGSWTDAIRPTQVFELMNLLQSQYSIDHDRLYITGLSMGGIGTWYYITAFPNMYAAAIPMSGWGDVSWAPYIAQMPIWNFHGAIDATVPVEYSRTMIDAVRLAGGHPIYTEYSDGGHVIWTPAYATSVMLDWVYAQRRGMVTTNPPTLSITTPTAQPIYASTNLTGLNLSGIASFGDASVDQATLTNSAYPGIQLGTGTTNWSVYTPLNSAATNLVVVIGTGPSLAPPLKPLVNGTTTFSDTLAVIFPPWIITQPQSQVANQGDTVTLSVSVTPVQAPTNYQWRVNGVNLPGRTNSALTLMNVQMADAGVYSVQVSNRFGTCTSSDATLAVRSVTSPCIAVANPDFEGGFNLAGGGYIANDWTEWEATPGVVTGGNETVIAHSGAHSQRIRITGGASGTSGGVYQRMPVIAGQPYAASVWMYAGDALTSCSLGVDPAGGTDPNTGVTWSPATTSAAWAQRTWAGTATADHLTVYFKVMSADGVERNGFFDDAIPAGCQNTPPGITRQPSNQCVVVGVTASFTVLATGEEPLSYQWQKDHANLSDGGHYSGSTTATLTISGADANDVASYRCVATNIYGITDSDPATLTANTLPSITQQPSDQSVPVGGIAGFTVLASGSGPLGYQWQKNNTDLSNGGHYSGSTTATLTISGADTNDAASYRCVVTYTCAITNSNPATLTVTTNLPSTPTAQAATGVTNNVFTANWSPASGATGYRLDVSTNGGFFNFVSGYQDSDAGNVLSRSVTGLGSGTTYYYRVRAYNGNGASANSGTISVTTILIPPSAPIANAATSVTTNEFVANWSSSVGATGYRLDVSTTNSFSTYVGGYLNLDVGDVLNWSVSGLSAGKTYYYRVRAYNGAGASSNSVTINIATVPAAPTANAATSVVSTAFTANWSGVTGVTGYRLDVSSDSAFGSYVSGWQDFDVGNMLSWGVGELTPGSTNYYRVRAYNSSGVGANSGTIAVTLPVTTSNACVVILNPDFESGFSLAGGGYIANDWTEWEAYPGVTVGFDETAIVHGGGHSQRIRVGGTNATAGAVYQRVPATAGLPYSMSVWIYAGDPSSACYLGVDPAGGTNANSGVTWSSVHTNATWVQKTWAGIATGNQLTIYYKVATPDNVKRNGYFDDAMPATGPLRLVAQRNGAALTLTWPECPSALLQRADSLSEPANWATATNPVSIGGGQKSVTLTPIPQSGTGYFRLVRE